MPNEMNFDVRFTRDQIQGLLVDPDVQYVIVSGTYSYQGNDVWTMEAIGEGCDIDNKKIIGSRTEPCIQPCPK